MEAKLYHFQTKKSANFAFLTFSKFKTSPEQKLYPVYQITDVLQELDASSDCYISMAEFYGGYRRTASFAQTMVAFVDFDTHKSVLGQYSPQKQADLVIQHCKTMGIPLPSLIVFSGRGLHAKWLFERYIPVQALPRWQALEKYLIAQFPPEFGVDKQVCDITRVLRIVGTRNTKSGEFCRVLWTNGNIANPARYGFDFLCDEVLPIKREDLRQKRLQRILEASERQGSKIILPDERKRGNLESHSIKEFLWLRYLDFMRLAEIRENAGILDGFRQKIFFWSLNSLAQAKIANNQQFWNEATAIAYRLGNFDYNSILELYRRFKAHQNGEKFIYLGKEVTPLYRAKTSTLIDYLEITSDEMAEMSVLIDERTVRERKREAQNKSYAETKQTNQEKRLNLAYRVRCLNKVGKSIREISEELKLAKSQVQRILNKFKST